MTTINEYRYRLIDYFTGEMYECTTIRTLYHRFDSLRREYENHDEPQTKVHQYHLVLTDRKTETTIEDWRFCKFPKNEEFWEHLFD